MLGKFALMEKILNSIFREKLVNLIIPELEPIPSVLAAWEGGSAANNSLDEYSDLDLCFLSSDNEEIIFVNLEKALQSLTIEHLWKITEVNYSGVCKRIYFFMDSPTHFFLDVSIFPNNPASFMEEILEIERHGIPKIFFDKNDNLKVRNTDMIKLKDKSQKIKKEIIQSFPVYKTIVLKEVKRGNSLDAFGFYQGGLVKPLVEVLGMVYRLPQYDFGLRYINKSFPLEIQMQLKNICYVSSPEELPERIIEIELLLKQALTQIEKTL